MFIATIRDCNREIKLLKLKANYNYIINEVFFYLL